MARSRRILIVGGSGVFGRLLARELLDATTAETILAGRDHRHTTAAARNLRGGARVEATSFDVANVNELATAAAGCFAVICTAGPFQSLPLSLPIAAIPAGAHWLDVSDDSGWNRSILGNHALAMEAAEARLAIMPGLSTVPALSGALLRWCCARQPGATTGQVTLFIGNRNAKGMMAIASVLTAGLDNPVEVELPTGRCAAYRVRHVDPLLRLPGEKLPEAEFRVAFELALGGVAVAMLSRVSRDWSAATRRRLASLLAAVAVPLSTVGSSTGCLQADVWADGQEHSTASFITPDQRMAIAPVVIAVTSLMRENHNNYGVVHPAALLTPNEWIATMQTWQIEFRTNHA